MKKQMCIIAWFCLAAVLLCGCQTKEPENTDPIITWDNIPQLTYGQMEAEKLTVLPWYSGRTEISTANAMAETEQGYYLIYNDMYLLYADKVDLSNWVLVCNQPDCKHLGYDGCSAYVSRPWLFVKDGRLYFLDTTGRGLYNTLNIGEIYVSTKPDGSDKRLEYVYEESHIGMMGGMGGDAQMGTVTLRKASRLNPQGEYDTHFYRIDDKGGREIQLPGTGDENTLLMSAGSSYFLRGKPMLEYGSRTDSSLGFYRLDGEDFVKLNLNGATPHRGYFDGNTLRIFRKDDGYYDINTATGEEIKISSPCYQNSMAVIMSPNCILETNFPDWLDILRPEALRPEPPQGESKIALFDGKNWREVAIPIELQTLSAQYMKVIGLTSDSVLVLIMEESYRSSAATSQLYRIPIGEEHLKLEYCGEITLATDEK